MENISLPASFISDFVIASLILTAWLKGWLVSKREYDKVEKRAEKAESKIDQYEKVIEEHVLSALSASANAVAKAIDDRITRSK